jgi:hypothetical protein
MRWAILVVRIGLYVRIWSGESRWGDFWITWGGAKTELNLREVSDYSYTVDSRLSAVMVGRICADNQNPRINRSTHTQARYTGIKLTGA